MSEKLEALKMGDNGSEWANGVEYRYSTSWIHALPSEFLWNLYWHQQRLMFPYLTPGDRILEIGVGSGFTANYLRSKGMQVTTLDIDSEKNPDIVANLVTYQFQEEYDHILAFEVFEHIPISEFEVVLGRVQEACKGYCFFSVPVARFKWIWLNLKLPRLPELRLSRQRAQKGPMSPHHFWEIERSGVTLDTVKNIVQTAGFRLIQTETVSSRIQFFVLKNERTKS